MKKALFFVLSLIALFPFSIQAQEFESTLAHALESSRTDSTLAQVAMTTNQIEMIAAKWSDQWLAHYYAAYNNTIHSYMESDPSRRDGLLDRADTHLQKAKDTYGVESDELFILIALIANARLAVDPGKRWKEFGPVFDENIAKAKVLNPDNPRIYYLQGNSIYYTPKMFGGGPKTALPYYEKADSLFRIFPIPESHSLAPAWGRYQNTLMYKKAGDEQGKKKRK